MAPKGWVRSSRTPPWPPSETLSKTPWESGLTDLPLTAEKVYTALRERGTRPEPSSKR